VTDVAFGRFSLSLRERRLERDGQAVKLGSWWSERLTSSGLAS